MRRLETISPGGRTTEATIRATAPPGPEGRAPDGCRGQGVGGGLKDIRPTIPASTSCGRKHTRAIAPLATPRKPPMRVKRRLFGRPDLSRESASRRRLASLACLVQGKPAAACPHVVWLRRPPGPRGLLEDVSSFGSQAAELLRSSDESRRQNHPV